MRCFVLGAMPFLVWGLPSWSEAVPPIPGFIFQSGQYIPQMPRETAQAKATDLYEPFPAMISLFKNPITPQKVHLGKLLFFDPILSGDNSLSCAHCHHPDYGFSDGRKTAMGVGGRGLGPQRTGGEGLFRSAPSLWNAAYNPYQFWDGRADDLEAQAREPITKPNEMNEQPDRLVAELLEIPQYLSLFQAAFGGDPQNAVTFENLIKALATFERTLLTFNSPFDRYAQGDSRALTEQELRGLALFRSEKTQCANCHPFPLFTDNNFRVIGVPDSEFDLGRGPIEGEELDGAFKVPTLRNVALTAPYMHNGSFETLADVIRFYADGAGRDNVFRELIDLNIGRFDMSKSETDDLVAFLEALTDTSMLPKTPQRVPSGLPLVPFRSKTKAATTPSSEKETNLQSMAPVTFTTRQLGD